MTKIVGTTFNEYGVHYELKTGELYRVVYSRIDEKYTIFKCQYLKTSYRKVGEYKSSEQNKLLKIRDLIIAGKYD